MVNIQYITLYILWRVFGGELIRLSWESAHRIRILLANGFRYLPYGSVCWMLLWVEENEINSRRRAIFYTNHFHMILHVDGQGLISASENKQIMEVKEFI